MTEVASSDWRDSLRVEHTKLGRRVIEDEENLILILKFDERIANKIVRDSSTGRVVRTAPITLDAQVGGMSWTEMFAKINDVPGVWRHADTSMLQAWLIRAWNFRVSREMIARAIATIADMQGLSNSDGRAWHEPDEWEACLQKKLKGVQKITTPVALDLLGVPRDTRTRQDAVRVGKALQRIGYLRRRTNREAQYTLPSGHPLSPNGGRLL